MEKIILRDSHYYEELIKSKQKNYDVKALMIFDIDDLYVKELLYVCPNINHLEFFYDKKANPNMFEGINRLSTNIEIILLHGKGFSELPEEIWGLENLSDLTVRSTNITELPKTKKLSLNKLEIFKNKFSSLDSIIYSCPNLFELKVDGERINNIPNHIVDLDQLQILILIDLEINFLTKQLDYLIEVCFYSCQMNLSEDELASLGDNIFIASEGD